MSIARLHRKRHNFSIIDNQAAEDKTLSWKARGILWYLLTKPDSWKVRFSDLLNHSDKDGRESLRSGFKELEQAGYAIRNKVRDRQGRFEWITEVFETKEDAADWLKQKESEKHHQGRKPVGGKPVDIDNTDQGITNSFNQGINQAHKAVPGTADRDAEFDQTDLPQEEISTTTSATGKTGSDSYTPHSNQKATPTTGLGDSIKDQGNAAFSPRKEKTSKGKQRKVAFKYDAYGVIQFPEAKRYKLPSILAMRTMQFLLARELECEFGIDKDGDVWISDPKMGDWMLEEEMFGGGSDREQGQLPLKKMVSILNSETSPSPLDIEWYNDTAKRYFEFWQSNCDRLGKDALPTIQRYGSIVHWLIKLEDEEFDIEFESIDLEDVA
jgi:hypothetical protein